jgi:hypothetical protein
MAPRRTQRKIALALAAAAASLLGGCMAEVDEPEVVDEQVGEVGHELEADGLVGFDAEGFDGEGFDAEAPGSQGAPPSPGSDAADDPEPTPWEPLLDDGPEPTPWDDPHRLIELSQGSSTTS